MHFADMRVGVRVSVYLFRSLSLSLSFSLSLSIERARDRIHLARLLWVVAVRILGEPARLSVGNQEDQPRAIHRTPSTFVEVSVLSTDISDRRPKS